MRRFLGIGLAALAACSPGPEHVYVPADNYVVSVRIVVAAEARAGEWVQLSAQRRSGPWKRVRRAEAPPGFTPFELPPPEFEAEVADNLFWMTEPPGARFDLPSGVGHQRKVLFDKPGTYQVWARSAYPTDAKSNVVAITVK